MSKYDASFKLSVVNYYSETGNGYRKAGKHFGIDRSQVRDWVVFYERHGEKGLCNRKLRPRHSLGVKRKLVKIVLSGQSIRSVAYANDISCSCLHRWLKEYHEYGLDGLKSKQDRKVMKKPIKKHTSSKKVKMDKETKALLEELEYLRTENAYLKKLDALIREKEAKRKQGL